MKNFDAIAFDLDGTLVDSAGGIAHALNAALAEAGLLPFELQTVRAWIGDGPDALITRALAASRPGLADAPALAAQLRRGFDAATLREPMAGSSVFKGITELLPALAAQFALVVVTNKPTPLARAVLKAAGLLAHFASVHGADTPVQRKPSPLLIQQAASALGTSAQRLLMVGDAAVDIGAARAAGSHAAWAGWGYGHAPADADADVDTDRSLWRLRAPHDLLAALALPVAAAPEP